VPHYNAVLNVYREENEAKTLKKRVLRKIFGVTVGGAGEYCRVRKLHISTAHRISSG
jgi:hypothetical protein